MKKLAEMVLILVARGISLAAGRRPNEIPTVLASVRFNNGTPPAHMVFRAEALASQMFAGVAVGIIWHSHMPVTNWNPHLILIEIASNTAERGSGDALAYSRPFEGTHITIFWDRLEETHNDATAAAQDIWQMTFKPLSFEPSDVRLIHAGLAAPDRATEGIPEQISAR